MHIQSIEEIPTGKRGRPKSSKDAAPARKLIGNVYRPKDIIESHDICKTKLYELLGSGELKSFTIGRSRYVRKADYDAFWNDRASRGLNLEIEGL